MCSAVAKQIVEITLLEIKVTFPMDYTALHRAVSALDDSLY